MPETVNAQITDSVTQSVAPTEALQLAIRNAVAAQQNANTILQATTTQGVSLIYSIDTTAATNAASATTSAAPAATLQDATKKIKEQLDNVTGELGSVAAVAGALQLLNDVALRQAINTIELAAVTMALAQVARAQSPEQLATATQMVAAIIRELQTWSNAI